MSGRYAIYYAPGAEHPLWTLGSSTIGYDARSGESLPPPSSLPVGAEEWRRLTEEPRRYGFHATLKAPFRLADGVDEPDLIAAVESLAAARAAVRLSGLRVALLGRFAALVPEGARSALQSLADSCVRELDALRSPLSGAERERRLRAPLSPREISHLDRWGYPHVFEDFRFHMTLTGPLPEAIRPSVLSGLEALFRAHQAPLTIDALTVFRQGEPDSPFHILARAPLAANAQL